MDLSTTYLGLKLKNPLVPSAGPLSADIDSIRQLEDAGAAAIVLHSLFEEQLSHEAAELDHLVNNPMYISAESQTYFPEATDYRLGPDEYLEHIQKAKRAVGVPIIASLNGVTPGGWLKYAAHLQEAGAAALELNVYLLPTSVETDGAAIEQLYVDILKTVKAGVRIPVALKLSPYFSATAAMCKRLDDAGADGLVLFNRFYQPDFDLDNLEVVPDLVLSTPHEMRLPLRWIAILYGKIKASLAATTGIATGHDVIKVVMAGADVAQVCSVLLRRGPRAAATILKDMQEWMEEKEYASVAQMKGSMSQKSVADPAAFERANYMKTLNSYA